MTGCRHCGAAMTESFADLGMAPLSNAFVPPDRARCMEPFYPLHALVCTRCWLVQLEAAESPERIFGDYAYFSSYSDTWLRHAEAYAAAMVQRYRLGQHATIVEVASNDGYLLRYFQRHGCRVLGVEPAANVAAVAVASGVPTEIAFFGVAAAERLRAAGFGADLMPANNVLAHVPDLADFAAGFAVLLNPGGVATFEVPHLLRQIQQTQFDTIYHEHLSYLSLRVVRRILANQGLRVFDVEVLATHGGSLRIFACHDGAGHGQEAAVDQVLEEERAAGLEDIATYRAFAGQVMAVKAGLLRFLLDARAAGKRVAAYGAPAKGNTLLNHCGIGPDLVAFTVDRSPHKQGTLLPGTRIPVHAPQAVHDARPDYLLILPWNLRDEVMQQMAAIRAWGGRFVVPIPSLQVL